MSTGAQSFHEAITLTRVGEGEHALDLPDGWQQGRGAFGGLVLGATLAAMVADEPDAGRTPRSFMGDICAPALPVPTRLRTRTLRRGKHQSNMTCDLVQDGQVVAHASAVLAGARPVAPVAAMVPAPPPVPGRFEDAPVAPIRHPPGPRFASHFEFRVLTGVPFAGGGEKRVEGWVREAVPLPRLSHAAVLARLDSFWPVLFAVEATPRPATTVSFTAEFLADPALLDPSLPFFYRAWVVAESGGYFVEMRELWSEGRPVALNQQTFAILA